MSGKDDLRDVVTEIEGVLRENKDRLRPTVHFLLLEEWIDHLSRIADKGGEMCADCGKEFEPGEARTCDDCIQATAPKQDDQFSAEWICSDCGSRLSDGVDSRWRWAGDEWQHKCPGNGPQGGHNPCRRFPKDIDCDSCDKPEQWEALHGTVGRLERKVDSLYLDLETVVNERNEARAEVDRLGKVCKFEADAKEAARDEREALRAEAKQLKQKVEQVAADAIKTLEIHHRATAGLVEENRRLWGGMEAITGIPRDRLRALLDRGDQ